MRGHIVHGMAIAFLILLSLFVHNAKTTLTYITNAGFESRDYSIPGSGVYRCPFWQSNSDGWRELKGDVNGDGKVDMKDIGTVAKAFGSNPGDPLWNPAADLNGDGKVDMVDVSMAAADFGKTATRKDGYYSWFANGGAGDYVMYEWLDYDVVMALANQGFFAFSFYFYPQTVQQGGSVNNARAEIYYEYNYGSGAQTVNGAWVAPTSLQWYKATAVVVSLPDTTSAIKIIMHGKPDFKAWVDSAEISLLVTYTVPPYSNQYTSADSGCLAIADRSNGMALAYSSDPSGVGVAKIAKVEFNTNPPVGNSPCGSGSSIGARWAIYGYLGNVASAVRIQLLLYYLRTGVGWEYVQAYQAGFDAMQYPNQEIYYEGTVAFQIGSPPRGSGTYAAVVRVYTSAAGSTAVANFLSDSYWMFVDLIKIT